MCSLVKEGGLGGRNSILFNWVRMGKWLWQYVYGRESLWRMVIDKIWEEIGVPLRSMGL